MKRAHFRTGNRDDNEKYILELLNRRNVKYVQLKPGDGADLLVMISPMELWEVKNPEQPPQKRMLTNVEVETQIYCANTKIPYFIIATVEEALARINNYFEV